MPGDAVNEWGPPTWGLCSQEGGDPGAASAGVIRGGCHEWLTGCTHACVQRRAGALTLACGEGEAGVGNP